MYFLRSFSKRLKVICLSLLLVSLLFNGGWWGRVRASQEGAGATILLADQGTNGIKGYVVGSSGVAAYACPDTNTSKCPIRLVLAPGTQVLIVDNVVGGFVPALNDNSWRKIVVQGQTVYVPSGYISLVSGSSNSSNDLPAVTFTVANEDDSTSAPSFSSAPVTKSQTVAAFGGFGSNASTWPCSSHFGTGWYGVPGSNFMCCPPGTTLSNGTDCVGYNVTWYSATDGRINGGAGDRIAVYCRRTGRIEVWTDLGGSHQLVCL